MLRFFSAFIQVLIIILAIFVDGSAVLFLQILFACLGTLFSYVNFRYRKGKVWLAVFLINTLIFLYYVVAIIIFFV